MTSAGKKEFGYKLSPQGPTKMAQELCVFITYNDARYAM